MTAMNRTRQSRQTLMRRYAVTLQKYLASEREAALEEAYELGRAAIAAGLGVLDMVRVHLEAREIALAAGNGRKSHDSLSKLARSFFLQALSPFEATHRGFRETNAQLLKRNRELAAEISERRRTEKALRESEERYSRLIESAQDVIFSLTPDGRIAAVNPAFEKITGWRRTDWLGKPFAPLIHPSEAAVAEERFYAVLQGKQPGIWEYRMRKADGQYTVGEFTVARELQHGKPVGAYAIGRDIYQRKMTEEALRQSEEYFRALYHEAQVMQDKLRDLSTRILHVQEEERKRISRELHDEVGQALTAISVTLAALRRNGATRNNGISRKVAIIQRLLAGTMENVHRFARELRPAMLDELGLLPALRSHVKSFSARTGLQVRFSADPCAEKLDGEQKTALFRSAQESLNNVAKHARASRVKILLRPSDNGIYMEISDNGKSFCASPETDGREKGRLGLLGMQERARLVNGQFSISPLLGRGTTVRVNIPVQGDAVLA